jgi:hypothetical protein
MSCTDTQRIPDGLSCESLIASCNVHLHSKWGRWEAREVEEPSEVEWHALLRRAADMSHTLGGAARGVQRH